ncbi:MAG: AMP-binding protein [Nostoc sp.]|uniref:AMP-binding protein n=1 Tax=Nostoc sp. TaxID=1180 RepID=UPI002FFC6A9B
MFAESTINRLVGHFETLLEAIVANPQQPVALLSLLTPQQRQQLLVEWNHTQVNYPHQLIHQLFEEQVQRTPDAIAVVFREQKLNYQELNEQANQLAYYLQSLGVTAEVMVGLCVERSLEMVVGLLGILKSGGVYVPLDPAYPQERIAYILSDSRLSVLLTQQKLVASLPKHQGRVVCLDTLGEEMSAGGELPPMSGVTPENLAYVIYTSGSTGKPKGVAIAHQGLSNLAKAQIKLFGVQMAVQDYRSQRNITSIQTLER